MKKIFIIGLAVCASSIGANAQVGGFGSLKGKKTATVVDTTKKTGAPSVTPTVTPGASSTGVTPKPVKSYDTTIVGGFGEVVPKSLRNETLADRKTDRSKIRWNTKI